MAKKENKKLTHVKEAVNKTIEQPKEQLDLISLVVVSTDKQSDVDVFINTIGELKGYPLKENKEQLHVGLANGSKVNWTQIKAFVNLVSELRKETKVNIVRFDSLNKTDKINPSFNLQHVIIKYNL